MTGIAVVDTNLLALLVVGSASRQYIKSHKRIHADFDETHFDLLISILGVFDEIVLLPQIVAETSNLVRQIGNPARDQIQLALKTLVETTYEFPAISRDAVARPEFLALGITDSVILHMCSMQFNGIAPTLVAIDADLVNRANSLGYAAIDYREFRD